MCIGLETTTDQKNKFVVYPNNENQKKNSTPQIFIYYLWIYSRMLILCTHIVFQSNHLSRTKVIWECDRKVTDVQMYRIKKILNCLQCYSSDTKTNFKTTYNIQCNKFLGCQKSFWTWCQNGSPYIFHKYLLMS